MSGATIGGIAGAFVGSFFGPLGTNIGWMLGSAIGGYVDPDVIKSTGPRLTDAQQQTARDGLPITIGYGTFPTTGNIIWRAPIVENVIVDRQRQGKGGGTVTETTTYQYTRSYAIGICEGPVSGLLIVKRNGVIVYDARTDAELTAIGYDAAQISTTRAGSAAWLSKVRFYTGSETQVADSTIEAHEGVGNVAPNRGLAYIVVPDDDLTEMRGAIPQYEFVVSQNGQETAGVGMAQWAATNGSQIVFSDDGLNWPEASETADAIQTSLTWGGGRLVKHQSGSGAMAYSLSRGEDGSWLDPADEIGPDALAYIDSKWWAVGGNVAGSSEPFAISQSVDADGWDTDIVIGTADAYTCVGGHHGLIVIGTNAGTAVYTTDGGDTWPTSTVIGTSEMARDIASDGTTVIMVSDAGLMQKTTNGSGWTQIINPFNPALGITRIVYSAGLGMWVATNGTEIGYSPNVNDWTLATLPGGWSVNELAAGNDVIVAVGSIGSGPSIFATTDGPTWTQRDDLVTGGPLTGVAWMPCDGTPIPGAPGYYVHDDGAICGPAGGTLAREQVVLATIVADICQRRGLTEDQYDVSDLTDLVDGYRIATEGGGDSFIAPLMAAYFFDAAEWDGKLRFIKRGGPSLLTLTMDDLAERDGDAIEITRAQEAELLRKNTVTYLDPAATYTPTTQQWERRAGTVLAKGEASIEIAVVATSTPMAQVAEKRGKVAWSESDKYAFSLPSRFSRITATDVVTLVDAESNSHRIRIQKIEEDSGVLLFEDAARDRQQAYIGTVTGTAPNAPPSQQPPPVRGPTKAVVFNGPPPTITGDAKAGFWIAATGMLAGWVGYDLYVSTDGGDTETYMGSFTNSGRVGWLRSGISSSSTTIPVQFYGDAEVETITDAQVDANQNIWIIKTGDRVEFGQTQTWTPNGDGFDGTDNTRGLLGIDPTSHSADDDFAMVDAGANYIPFDTRFAGTTLLIRPVSIGTSVEDNQVLSLVYDPPEIVWEGNGEIPDGTDGPDPDPGGAGTPGTPTARTIAGGSTTVSLTTGEAAATANSAAVNAAFVSNGTVITPAGTYYFDTSTPIEPLSNRKLDFATNGTILRAKGSNTTTSPSVHRDIIRIDGVHDVEIEGGSLVGYREYWRANGGVGEFGVSEWAHGIYITNSSYNVTIWDTTFEKFVGDGISIGRSAHDVHVLNIKSTNNRRQGISTGGDDILIENCECSYIGGSDGTAPMAGIDIEVDEPASNSATNVTILNCYLHHNTRTGLTVYKSCNNITIDSCRIEDNTTQGIYAYDSDDVDVLDCSIKRNGVQGISLGGTCTNWNIDGCTLYSNRTRQYGTYADGLDTTTSPTATQKSKQVSVAATVTGTTYGTNEWGPV